MASQITSNSTSPMWGESSDPKVMISTRVMWHEHGNITGSWTCSGFTSQRPNNAENSSMTPSFQNRAMNVCYWILCMRRYFISCYWYFISCCKDLKIRPVPGIFVCCASFKFWWMFCLVSLRTNVIIFHFIYLTEAKITHICLLSRHTTL